MIRDQDVSVGKTYSQFRSEELNVTVIMKGSLIATHVWMWVAELLKGVRLKAA